MSPHPPFYMTRPPGEDGLSWKPGAYTGRHNALQYRIIAVYYTNDQAITQSTLVGQKKFRKKKFNKYILKKYFKTFYVAKAMF